MRVYMKAYRKKHRARLDANNSERQKRMSVEMRKANTGLIVWRICVVCITGIAFTSVFYRECSSDPKLIERRECVKACNAEMRR
jgi:hypothetical protein